MLSVLGGFSWDLYAQLGPIWLAGQSTTLMAVNLAQTFSHVFAHADALVLAQDAPPVPTVDEAVDGVSRWWNDPATQDLFIARPAKILLIILVALALHGFANRIINRAANKTIENTQLRVAEQDDSPQARSQEARRVQRIRTLANVGRSAAAIVIWVWAALATLDQLGVNVAPLIASAGVLGVALGFGAQSLVKDFLTGIFMLIENQYGVGDTIQVGDIVGDVEEMTLRITTIRDIDGTLWYVQNGDISRLGNHSDRFSIARLQIPVSLLVDPADAAPVIEQAAIDASFDPEVRELILEDPELLGASEFNPTHMSFRVSVKTLPGQQWTVARHINQRILTALQQAGIDPMQVQRIDGGINGGSND